MSTFHVNCLLGRNSHKMLGLIFYEKKKKKNKIIAQHLLQTLLSGLGDNVQKPTHIMLNP